MCGIAGFIQRDSSSPPDPAVLESMCAALHHRGPDATSHCTIDKVGLAHTRLALLGLGECGAQPMRTSSSSGEWAITYNGEIFNHEELRTPGEPYRGHSDTESLLAAIARDGIPNTITKLNGFFAFAALDRGARKLHLVRDPFGVKPIFYSLAGGRFYFASEAKAILAAGLPAVTELETFRHHIVHRWCHGRATPFAGIFKVLPGERLEVDLDTLEVTRIQWSKFSDWTDPDYSRELATLPREELVELVDHHFQRAVRRRLLADVPVATLCSGGVDSSLITACAAGERAGLQAFVIQPLDDPDSDESGYAQQVCDRAGATLNRVPFDSATWREAFLESIPHFENPLWIETSMGSSLVAGAIAGAGFKAALGGDAADELFGGYDYRYPEERQAFAEETGRPLLDIRTDQSIMPVEPDTARALGHPNIPPESEREFVDSVRADAWEAYAHLGGARRALEAKCLAETRLHMAIGFDQKDKATMRSSLEYREPFLDTDLVRLVVNLPLEAKTFPEIKGVLRDAARPHLPEPVLTRKKVGFTYNTDRLLEGKIRPSFYTDTLLEQLLGVKNKKVAKWFGPGRGRATFRVCSAEIWLRHFINDESLAKISEDLWEDEI